MTVEEKTSTFAWALPCVENLLSVQSWTQTSLNNVKVQIVCLKELSEQIHAVEGDFETCVDHEWCILLENITIFLFWYGVFPLESDFGCLSMAYPSGKVPLDMNLALFWLPLVKVLHFNLSDMKCYILLVLTNRELLLVVLELYTIVTLEAHWRKLHNALQNHVHEFNVNCRVEKHIDGLNLCLIISIRAIITLTSEKFLEQA